MSVRSCSPDPIQIQDVELNPVPSFTYSVVQEDLELEVAKIVSDVLLLQNVPINNVPINTVKLKAVFEQLMHNEPLGSSVAKLGAGYVRNLARQYYTYFPSSVHQGGDDFVTQEDVVMASEPMSISGEDLSEANLAYIQMNLQADLPVAALMGQIALPLLDKIKSHISGQQYIPQSSHPIFALTEISPEKFFAQVLEARIKNKPKLLEDIRAKLLSALENVSSCGMSEEEISEYISAIISIQQTLEMPCIEKATSVPVLAFQYYLAKTLRSETIISDLCAARSHLSGTGRVLLDIEWSKIVRGSYQLDRNKSSEIQASLFANLPWVLEAQERRPYRISCILLRSKDLTSRDTNPTEWDQLVSWIKSDPKLKETVQGVVPWFIQKLLS